MVHAHFAVFFFLALVMISSTATHFFVEFPVCGKELVESISELTIELEMIFFHCAGFRVRITTA